MTGRPPPLAVGLAGAGPWARRVHAPLLAAGPHTRLAAVWSRTAEAAAALAAHHGVPAVTDFDDLVERCEAVALAVPPAIQPRLAVQAADARRALLLEKPLALDVPGAEAVAAAVERAGVGSVVLLTYRFSAALRRLLARAPALRPVGGRACYLSGSFLGGPWATGWRLEHGALLDVGPHVLDLVDAALGPVTSITAHGDPHRWVGLLCEHESGAASEVSLSCVAAMEPGRTEVEVFGPRGCLAVDCRAGLGPEAFATVAAELAATARAGGGHPVDAARGLHVQRLVDRAATALRSGR